jgi:hypothetical protein
MFGIALSNVSWKWQANYPLGNSFKASSNA